MVRRHSRTPMVLTDDNRKILIARVDGDETLRGDIESLLKVSWTSLTSAEKIGALRQYEEGGYALSSLAGAARGYRDFGRAASDIRGEVSLEDTVALLREQVSSLEEKLRERDATIARMDAEKKTVAARRVVKAAGPAMATHSGSTR